MNSIPFNSQQSSSLQTKYLILSMLEDQVCGMPFVSNKVLQSVFSSPNTEQIAVQLMYQITEQKIRFAPKVFKNILMNMQQNTGESFEPLPDEIIGEVEDEDCYIYNIEQLYQ